MDPQAPPPRPADAAGGSDPEGGHSSASDFSRFDDTGYPVVPEPARRRFPAWPAVVVGIIGLLLLLFGVGLTGAAGMAGIPASAADTGRTLTILGLALLVIGLVGGAVRSLAVRQDLPEDRYRGPSILLLFALVLVLGNVLSLPFASQLAGALLGGEALPAGIAIVVLVITPVAFLLVTGLFVLLPRALVGLRLHDDNRTLLGVVRGIGLGALMWIGATIVSAIVAVIYQAATGTTPTEEQAVVNLIGALPLPLALLAAAVLAPLAEELFFRGVVFNAWERERGPRWALVGSAILFAAVHLLDGSLLVFFPILFVGLALAYVYARTRSLPTVFGMHAAFNGISLLLAFFLPNLTR